jgi:hypothetical protein
MKCFICKRLSKDTDLSVLPENNGFICIDCNNGEINDEIIDFCGGGEENDVQDQPIIDCECGSCSRVDYEGFDLFSSHQEELDRSKKIMDEFKRNPNLNWRRNFVQ